MPDDDPEHVLYRRETWHQRAAVYFEDTGESGDYTQKTRALRLHYDPLIERTSTIYCTCGDAFRKDETALEHVREHGVEAEHRYNPEMWEDSDE